MIDPIFVPTKFSWHSFNATSSSCVYFDAQEGIQWAESVNGEEERDKSSSENGNTIRDGFISKFFRG